MESERENLQTTKSEFRSNAAQIIAVCIKNTLLLSFGMTLGFPTILIPGIQQPDTNNNFNLSQEAISWIGSINLICVPLGCIVSGPITQAIGRKKTMLLINIPFLCAWILFKCATSVYMVFIALCITGLSGGLLEAPVITYVAEICQPRLRGMLSSTSSMSVIVGILVQFLFGTFMNWQTVALVNCIFPTISFILICFVPESPHWLILNNRYLDARKSIAWLRGWTSLEEIEAEFKDLCRHIGSQDTDSKAQTKTEKVGLLETIKLYTKKNFLWPYTIVSFCFFLGHFCGMTTLQTYAVQIFASLKAPIDKYVATVYLGIAEVLGCLVCVFSVHRFGKRKINFASLIGSGICFVIVATYAYYIGVQQLATPMTSRQSANMTYRDDKEEFTSDAGTNWIPLIFLILSAFLSHVGIRILPWILTGELYSNETRAAASGLSGAIAYVFGFLANKTFLSLASELTLPGIFWFNAGFSFVGCILLYAFLPETEGKPLWEITDHFRGLKRLTNSVRRKDKNGNITIANGKCNDGFHLDNLNKGPTVENHI